jgi:hypothetical protein
VSVRPVYLAAGCLVFWLLLALPARALGVGDGVVLGTLALALLCLVPAVLTLILADRIAASAPEQRLLITLGSTGFRMFVVLGVAWALHRNVPFFEELPGYWMWLVVFYLFTLALEIVLLLAASRRDEQHATPAPLETRITQAPDSPQVLNGR